MKKIIIKSTVFIILFALTFTICSNVFVRKGNGYGTDVLSFYNEPKNSMDLIFFGSSHSYSTFSPEVLEKETGMKSYNFATQQQPLWITYHYMVEALKYQKPKYFVLDVLMTSVNEEYMEEGVNRDAIDKMRMSVNKIEVINVSVPKQERLSYYINFIKYHSRWNDLGKTDILSILPSNISNKKGFTYLEGNQGGTKLDITNIKEKKELSEKNKKYFNKIIKLAKDNGIRLILVKTPCSMTEEKQMYYNTVKELSDKNDLEFLNYNLIYDELELEFEKDFYDSGHLNGAAAEKVTKHFSKYIKNIS